jgi:uncharacterized protein YdaU (DUF1376 family)
MVNRSRRDRDDVIPNVILRFLQLLYLSGRGCSMKNKFKWMPVYWNDEEIDTIHLSATEFGVYMLLLSYYWRNGGPIPDNEVVLARAARMSLDEFDEVKANVLHQFELHDGFWHHHPTDAKFKECREVSEKNSGNARKRWAKSDSVVVHLAERE